MVLLQQVKTYLLHQHMGLTGLGTGKATQPSRFASAEQRRKARLEELYPPAKSRCNKERP